MSYVLILEKKSILKIMVDLTKSLKLKIKVQEITIQNIANTARDCETRAFGARWCRAFAGPRRERKVGWCAPAVLSSLEPTKKLKLVITSY